MAVPTISTVTLPDGSAAVGHSTGLQLLKVSGTNFRVPDGEPVGGGFGDPDADWQRTVQVTIDGEVADSAVPVSSTLCWVVVPEYLGLPSALPKTVDLVLKNLDDNGDPIVGEEATEADAYIYKRPQLLPEDGDGDEVAEGALKWTNENVILYFQRHLLENTVLTSDPDYSDDPSSGLTALASLPGILLIGPRVLDDPMRLSYHPNETEVDAGGGTGEETYAVTVPRIPKILRYQIHLVTDHKGELLNLQEAAENVLFKRPRLKFRDKRGGSDTIDLQMRLLGSEWSDADDGDSHIRRSFNTLDIQGLRLVDTHGVESYPPTDGADAVAFTADEDAPTLEVEPYDG